MDDLRDAVLAAAEVRSMPGGVVWRILMPDAVGAIAAQQEVDRRSVELAALDADIVPVHYIRNIARFAIRGQMTLLKSGLALVAAGPAARKCLEALSVSGVGDLRIFAPTGIPEEGGEQQHADELAALARNLNASVTVSGGVLDPRRGNPVEALRGVSLVACCLENAMDETLLQAACRRLTLPLVCAGVAGTSVQATTVMPGDRGVALIYRPDHPHLAKERPGASFAEGKASTIAGAWLAEQAIAVLLEDGEVLRGQLRYANLYEGEFETYPLDGRTGLMPTAIQFGAGNIGRGFMGHLFCEAGLETVFVDVVPQIVTALNARRSYPLQLVGPDRHETLTIKPVRAVDGRDLDAVASELATADIACTAVGVAALPHVAPALALGLRRRFENAPPAYRPLNVLLCENQLHCADLLRGLVEKELGRWALSVGRSGPCPGYSVPNAQRRVPQSGRPPNAQRSTPNALALIETVVARMVPVVPEDERRRDPLLAIAEDYQVLPIDRRAVIGPLPPISALLPVDDLFPWTERKLYCHNLGHAAAAYVGYRHGHMAIDQAMADPEVASAVNEATDEAGEALCRKHGFDRAEQRDYRDDLLRRFRNPALGDTVARVGRDPLRKLRAGDRLVGGLLLCLDESVEPHGIATAIAAALRYDAPDDPSAAELHERLRRDGLDAVLTSVCGLPPDSDAAGMIHSALERLPEN